MDLKDSFWWVLPSKVVYVLLRRENNLFSKGKDSNSTSPNPESEDWLQHLTAFHCLWGKNCPVTYDNSALRRDAEGSKSVNEIWNTVGLTTQTMPYNKSETAPERASQDKNIQQSFNKYPTCAKIISVQQYRGTASSQTQQRQTYVGQETPVRIQDNL